MSSGSAFGAVRHDDFGLPKKMVVDKVDVVCNHVFRPRMISWISSKVREGVGISGPENGLGPLLSQGAKCDVL